MEDTTNTRTTESRKPIHKMRLGSLSVSIWENEGENGRNTCRTSLVKSYRDSQGNWQETTSFRADDLILVSELAKRAADWILARENESQL